MVCNDLSDFSLLADDNSKTDTEMSEYHFLEHLYHYMDGNKISESTCKAIEWTILFLSWECWMSACRPEGQKDRHILCRQHVGRHVGRHVADMSKKHVAADR